MKTFPWDHFDGLDLRPCNYGTDSLTLSSCQNVDLAPGKFLRVRPALVKALSLSSESVGIYAIGGALRTVVPGGNSIVSPSPGVIQYDSIYPSAGGTYPTGKLSSLVASTGYKGNPFVTVQRSDTGANECHYIAGAGTAQTQVVLPFAPGGGLMTAQGRVWATAPASGTVNFCHLVNGPMDWSTPSTPTSGAQNAGDGAGFIAASSNASGARILTALAPYRGVNTANGIMPTMAVYFTDSIQLWTIDTNANNNAIRQTIGGPGTSFPGSIANVSGDVLFFSAGQFRSLFTATIVAEARDTDIAANIYELTKNLTGPTMRALWSSYRSQYICAVGNTVYVYLHAVTEKENGWTTWTLPVNVDYMVELNNVIWIRSGNTLYYLDVNGVLDDGGVPIAFNGAPRENPLGKGLLHSRKAVRWVNVMQNAPCAWSVVADSRAMNPRNFPGGTRPTRQVASGIGRQIGLRFSGTTAAGVAPWILQGAAIEFEQLAT